MAGFRRISDTEPDIRSIPNFYLGTYFAHSLTYVAKAWVFFSKTGADLKQWYFAINKDSFDYKKSHFRYLIPKEEKL